MATIQGLYKGFSSFEFQRKKSFKIRDIELVKLDLLNHIFTKRGERVMMPTFGTQIPEMTFEPLDDTTVGIVESEVTRVIDFDPRVELLDINVQPDYDTGSLYVGANVLYIELNLVDNLELNIQFGESS
jgi:phage baseplate assembly protein W